MGRVFRGASVRVLYGVCIATLTLLVVIMYEGGVKLSGSWVFGGGIVVLIIEGLITNKMTQGFDWRWYVKTLCKLLNKTDKFKLKAR